MHVAGYCLYLYSFMWFGSLYGPGHGVAFLWRHVVCIIIMFINDGQTYFYCVCTLQALINSKRRACWARQRIFQIQSREGEGEGGGFTNYSLKRN